MKTFTRAAENLLPTVSQTVQQENHITKSHDNLLLIFCKMSLSILQKFSSSFVIRFVCFTFSHFHYVLKNVAMARGQHKNVGSIQTCIGDGIACSLQRLTTGWMVRFSNPGMDKKFFLQIYRVEQDMYIIKILFIEYYLLPNVSVAISTIIRESSQGQRQNKHNAILYK